MRRMVGGVRKRSPATDWLIKIIGFTGWSQRHPLLLHRFRPRFFFLCVVFLFFDFSSSPSIDNSNSGLCVGVCYCCRVCHRGNSRSSSSTGTMQPREGAYLFKGSK